jgi:hypothetical protein
MPGKIEQDGVQDTLEPSGINKRFHTRKKEQPPRSEEDTDSLGSPEKVY